MEKAELKKLLGTKRTEVEAKQAEVRRKFGEHMTVLEEMEALGFDLDVASEVYAADILLDPEDEAGFIKKWTELLKAMKEKPGNSLLLVKHYKYDSTTCHGMGASSDYRNEVTYVFFSSVSSIIFNAEDSPSVVIKGDGVMVAPGLDSQSSNRERRYARGTILHPRTEKPSPDEIVVGLHTIGTWETLVFDFANEGVMALYDPSIEQASSAIEARGGYHLSFTEVLRKIHKIRNGKNTPNTN